MRALIVEDSPTWRVVLAGYFEEHPLQWTISVASRLDEAIRFLNGATVDLIVLDLLLPDTIGSDSVRMLQHFVETTTTPILVLSGLDDPTTQQAVRARGVKALLSKRTTDVDLFLATIDRILSGP